MAAVSAITGCAGMHGIAPTADRQDPSTLDAGAAIRAADADAQWPSVQWWQAYGDPQLDRWMDLALAGSPTLAIAADRVRQAQALAGLAQSAQRPHLDGSMNITREHWPNDTFYGPGPLASSTDWNDTASLSLSYHLDIWGRDKSQTERALDHAHAIAADARAAQLEIEVNVVRAYVSLSTNFALLDIEQQLHDEQQHIADIARERLRVGLGTQLELTQAQARIPETERAIAARRAQIALARNQLALLAGKGPGAADALERPTLVGSRAVTLPSTLPAELVGHRPDVVAARWNVSASTHGIDAAKAAFYPDIDMLASLGGMAVGGGALAFLNSASRGASVGPAVSLPIFDGGRLRAQLGDAAAQYDLAVDAYNRTLVVALNEIANAVVSIKSLETQETAVADAVALAQKGRALSDDGYRRGLTDYLNVLTSQTQWLHAKLDAEQIRAAQLDAHASLEAALGGGLGNAPDEHDVPQDGRYGMVSDPSAVRASGGGERTAQERRAAVGMSRAAASDAQAGNAPVRNAGAGNTQAANTQARNGGSGSALADAPTTRGGF